MPSEVAAALLRAIYLIWLTVMGGCVGSFLNVVVYRYPRGLSLSYPGSHCPACDHPIRWYHNLPVLGWFVLRGRCYDCRASISFRYPLVEAATAFMFLAVAIASLSSDAPRASHGTPTVALVFDRIAWMTYAWEVTLLCTLGVLALMDHDLASTAVARSPVWPAVVVWIVGVLLAIFEPSVFGNFMREGSLRTAEWASIVQHVGLGTFAACALGLLLLAVTRRRSEGVRQMIMHALAGAYLGPWLLMGALTASRIVLSVPRWMSGRRMVTEHSWWRWTSLFWLATLAAIVGGHVRPQILAGLTRLPSLAKAGLIGGLLLALVLHGVESRPGNRRVERPGGVG